MEQKQTQKPPSQKKKKQRAPQGDLIAQLVLKIEQLEKSHQLQKLQAKKSKAQFSERGSTRAPPAGQLGCTVLTRMGAKMTHLNHSSKESMTLVNGNVSGAGISYPINPGDPLMFRRGANIAQTWSRYRVRKLRYHYIPIATMFAAQATTGRIVLSFNPDPDDSPTVDLVSAEARFSVAGEPSKPLTLSIPAAMLNYSISERFVRRGQTYEGEAGEIFDVGLFDIFVTGCGNTNQIGEILVEYEFDFIEEFVPSLGQPAQSHMFLVAQQNSQLLPALAQTILTMGAEGSPQQRMTGVSISGGTALLLQAGQYRVTIFLDMVGGAAASLLTLQCIPGVGGGVYPTGAAGTPLHQITALVASCWTWSWVVVVAEGGNFVGNQVPATAIDFRITPSTACTVGAYCVHVEVL